MSAEPRPFYTVGELVAELRSAGLIADPPPEIPPSRFGRLLCWLGIHREGEEFNTTNGWITPCARCGVWLEEFEWDW